MIRRVLAVTVALFSSATFACDKVDAVFENEHASNVLSVLATEADLKLVNPELATSRINATFEGENASKLLRVLAWDLGFELRVQGSKAWLHQVSATSSEAQAATEAGP